jgi:hypothetical protein
MPHDGDSLIDLIDKTLGHTDWTWIASPAQLRQWEEARSPAPPAAQIRHRRRFEGYLPPRPAGTPDPAHDERRQREEERRQQNIADSKAVWASPLSNDLHAGTRVVVCMKQGEGGIWSTALEHTFPRGFWPLGFYMIYRELARIVEFGRTRATFASLQVRSAPAIPIIGAPSVNTSPPKRQRYGEITRLLREAIDTFGEVLKALPDDTARAQFLREKVGCSLSMARKTLIDSGASATAGRGSQGRPRRQRRQPRA